MRRGTVDGDFAAVKSASDRDNPDSWQPRFIDPGRARHFLARLQSEARVIYRCSLRRGDQISVDLWHRNRFGQSLAKTGN